MAVDAHHRSIQAQPASSVAAHFQANRSGALFSQGRHGCYGVVLGETADLLSTRTQSGGAQQSHKRKRSPVLDAAVASHRQWMEDINRLLLNHTTQIAEQTRKYTKLVMETVEAKAAKRLQEKDREIQKLRRMNWALEERLKFVYDEVQLWRNIAQSSEATVNALRGELDETLNMHAGQHGDSATADNAESCCYGENKVTLRREEEEMDMANNQSCCKGCGEAVAQVVLLPCRHLCMCVSCADALLVCPACGCTKNGTVCVNSS